MSFEENIIKTIRNIIPKSSLQMNDLFESDSEILNFYDNKMLINIDTFSKEDNFNENDFYTLGWNLAVGGISDILASGGRAVFYGQSLIIKKDWDANDIKKLTKGVKEVLEKTGAHFIGGDLGVQDDWSYTAVVIGKPGKNILTRKNAKPGDVICLSGEIGKGNLMAAYQIYKRNKLLKSKFNLRINESELIKKYSNCCIDTSDGLFNSLNIISEQSNTGYEITEIPYIKSGLIISKLLSIPQELLFLCECGEYELLFTISEDKEKDFFNEAKTKKMKFYKIGKITGSKERILKQKNNIINLSHIKKRARDFNNIKQYLNYLINCLKERKK